MNLLRREPMWMRRLAETAVLTPILERAGLTEPLIVGVRQFGRLVDLQATSLKIRAGAPPGEVRLEHPSGGSLLGAWFGGARPTRLRSDTLYRVISVLLVGMAVMLMVGHSAQGLGHPMFADPVQLMAGVAAGYPIGAVASLLGVAGGELLIPTSMLLFGVDVKLAASLSLAVSLPTMPVGFARYSLDDSSAVLRRSGRFVAAMPVGPAVGSLTGQALQQWVDSNTRATIEREIAAGLLGVLNCATDSDLGRMSRHLSGDAFDIQPVEPDAANIKEAPKAPPGLRFFWIEKAIWCGGTPSTLNERAR